MPATAITNTTIAKYNTGAEFKLNAATMDTAGKAEEFAFTPTGKPNKVVFGFQVANTHGSVSIKFSKSPGVFGANNLTIECPQNKTTVVQIEHGRFVQADGTIAITATPATGKKLKTDHALNIFAVELI
jgi:hypothetical protein